MNKPLICTIGEALYGPHWVRPLAATLKVSERTMRYWQDGTREPPAGIWRELRTLCRDHAKRLEVMAAEIIPQADPPERARSSSALQDSAIER